MRRIKTSLMIALLLTACSGSDSAQESESSTDGSLQIPITYPQIYHAYGVIKSIPPNKKQVIVSHGEIPGFMRAMTMPFNLPDSSIVEGIMPGDSISMMVQYDGETIVLKEITLIESN